MRLGIVGLGRMGGNIARRLRSAGHAPVVHDRDAAIRSAMGAEGFDVVEDYAGVAGALLPPRIVWLMLPSGAATEAAVEAFARIFGPGDILIDGGNSYWKDTLRRAKRLSEIGIRYLDVGTSGGVWGLERGYCLMIGGRADAFTEAEEIFAALAPGPEAAGRTRSRAGAYAQAEHGYVHAGSSGAGHFAKMVHNGIEYGMMQAMAEGFEILDKAGSHILPDNERLALDVSALAEVWRRGSVISSWLLDLVANALAQDKTLAAYSGSVQDSGEGRWVLGTAIEEEVSAPVIAAALFTRYRSRQKETFGEKLLSAMRKEFGGHAEAPR